MGVGVQASCYCAPLDWQQENYVTNAANSSTSAIRNWQQEIEGLLDELQIMALTMTLDANTFSSGDELNAEFRRIEMNFFAPWFDTQRMRRVFRKLGQDVLRRTLQNAPQARLQKPSPPSIC
ncbi:hypothetical protein LTR24_003216 [Lithohypha guttulata]|uniref:Uncharacterized protein n=1 Tax=Lithohypha guttulata TaxID=1690604 RepID=A0ABR0KFR6_9EURO|nr:hypothetical protein LTR24_003216 [Lithohypha guttulata]